MNRCQDAESKEGRLMKGVPYSERVTVSPLSVSPVEEQQDIKGEKTFVIARVDKQ